MKLSFNKNIINKPEEYPIKENATYENTDLSRQEVADILTKKGYTICSQINGNRITQNFVAVGFLGIDIDNGWTLEEALSDHFTKDNSAIIYTTANHRKNGNGDKFRIIFELKEPITSAEEHKKTITTLLTKYPSADKTCSDCVRPFYGNTESEPIILDGYLDTKELIFQNNIKMYQESNLDNDADKIPVDLSVSYEDAEEMLSFIPPDIQYQIWRNICFGIANHFGDVGLKLIEEWSCGNDGHYKELFKRSDGRVTIGTVLYHASKCGYKIPERLKNLRTSGQVAFQDIFDSGKDFVTLGDEIYHYEDNFYKKINSGHYQSQIAKYFNKYPTDKKGKKDFAKAYAVTEALKFAKALTYKNPDLINPPGINLRNGYLKLSYNAKREPEFNLVPHSPDNIFTYKADFEYKPDCDTSILQEALNKILDSGQQEILISVLAASLDLKEVRKNRNRPVRLLLLIGEGSNGKDTLKEWISLLYGKHGVTVVPLGSFHAADKGRLFGLYPLISSKVNWSSENQKIKIDSCQTLKTFITGEDIIIEKKFKDSFEIRPKAIGLFNLNEEPIFESTSEAVKSRFAILKFEKVFKSNPDPNKPWEIKGEAKFKEDEEFIKENILPALLNLMLAKFKEILVKDIDYSINDVYLEDICETVNHLNEFIREFRVVRCDVNEGISPKELYEEHYLKWCYSKELIDYKSNDSEHETVIFNDPHKYDRIVRGFRQITPAIKKVLPNIQEKRTPNGNILGIKVLGKAIPEDLPY